MLLMLCHHKKKNRFLDLHHSLVSKHCWNLRKHRHSIFAILTIMLCLCYFRSILPSFLICPSQRFLFFMVYVYIAIIYPADVCSLIKCFSIQLRFNACNNYNYTRKLWLHSKGCFHLLLFIILITIPYIATQL